MEAERYLSLVQVESSQSSRTRYEYLIGQGQNSGLHSRIFRKQEVGKKSIFSSFGHQKRTLRVQITRKYLLGIDFHCFWCFFKTCVLCTSKSRHAMVAWTPDLFHHQLQHALNMLYEEFQSQRHHIGEDPWS